MVDNYYAGHNLKWMGEFLKAVSREQKGQELVGSTAHSIACSIHHQYIYKRQKTFKLSRKTLALFGIKSRCLRPYLTLFQQAGLIKFRIKRRKSPIITLISIPLTSNTINKT